MKAGIWLIDKPKGLSSAQLLSVIKRRVHPAKIGHAGTLDPMATGLLVVLVNGATRLAHYAEAGSKVYSGTIDLGMCTSTDDVEGEVLSREEHLPAFEVVAQAAGAFVGEIAQVPPAVSAVKVNGERSYRLARAGCAVELKPRTVQVHRLDLAPVSRSRVFFRMSCSKGTYVRAIARDLGRALGCGGCLSSLRREIVEPFRIENALRAEDADWDNLLEWPRLFPGAPRMSLDRESSERLRLGDQRALVKLQPALDGLAGSVSVALYQDSSSQQACGLLVRGPGNWQLAANLS